MDQVHVVRHKVLVEKQPIRQVARELGIARNTVRKYLEQPEPKRVESQPRARPVWGQVKERLQELLATSPQWSGRKQRLTGSRLHAMLVEEGFVVGRTVVHEAVKEWKRQRREVFVPLEYAPGDLAEVDFFEVLIDIDGVRTKAWMFVMRLMSSKRDFAWLYDRQDQVCFLDGHVRAFAHFACIPQRIAYDNLKAAVVRHLVGSERELTPRFMALVSHYLFEAVFCRPYTGHDKGGVEARGRAIRLQHLVPIPRVARLIDASTALLARLDARFDVTTFETEKRASFALPASPFDARRTMIVGVSSRSLVSVEGTLYSVPCVWAGLDVTVHVGASTVFIAGPSCTVEHRRGRFGGKVVIYTHYLRELATKPQAVRQVASSLVRDLGPPFDRAWRALVDAHGPKQAARVFAKVLGFIETKGASYVATRIEDALVHDVPLLLALSPKPDAVPSIEASLPEKLRHIEVSKGSAADYDLLVGGAS